MKSRPHSSLILGSIPNHACTFLHLLAYVHTHACIETQRNEKNKNKRRVIRRKTLDKSEEEDEDEERDFGESKCFEGWR